MAAPVGVGRTRLVVSARVVFVRPLFGMRTLIERSSLEARPCCLPPAHTSAFAFYFLLFICQLSHQQHRICCQVASFP